MKDVRRWDRSLVIEEKNHTASLAEGGGPFGRIKLVLYCGFGVVMLHGLYVSRDGNKLLFLPPVFRVNEPVF